MIIDPRSSYYITEKERLLREIAEKEARLNALNSLAQDTPDKLISESLLRKRKLHNKSYIKFIVSSLRENRLFGVWERLLKYFRRFRLLTTVLKIVNYLIAFISTGAFFISVIIVAVPVILLASLLGFIGSFNNRRKIIRYFHRINDFSSITVIFSSDYQENAILNTTAAELAANGEIVFIVGASNSKYRYREQANGVFFINQLDYFILNKRFFSGDKAITHIHL